MRKRRKTQKGSLSSAQAIKESTSNREDSQKNVAEQQGEELMGTIGDLLHGRPIDEVISIGMSVALDGVRQKSHGNPLLAMRLFKQVVETMSEAFLNVTLKQCIDGIRVYLHP